MSGHNKWSKIKNKKGSEDIRKGKVFTKLGRNITLAAREGGKDAEYNAALKAAIDKAKAENMPNDNIERAIKKGTGELGGAEFVELTYEGYGPAGVAIIVTCLSDNKNRTAADVRHIFDKYSGNLGQDGSVSFMFDKLGVIALSKDYDEDELMMLVLDAGGEDLVEEEEAYLIYTKPEELGQVRNKIAEQDYDFLQAEVEYIPKSYMEADDEARDKVEKIIDMLEDLDDVQEVYHNLAD